MNIYSYKYRNTAEYIKAWEKAKTDKHLFTYSLRFPKQSKSGEYEIVIKEYLCIKDATHITVKPINDDSQRTLSNTSEGLVINNRVWFTGYSKEDHYKDAIRVLTEYQVNHMERVKKKYEEDMETIMNSITFLTSDNTINRRS